MQILLLLLLTLLILNSLIFEVSSALFYQNTFVTKFHGSSKNPDDPLNTPMQIIKYIIKVPFGFPKNEGPVFYGLSGGRESIDEMKERFKLFEQTSPYFNNAALVFVEHRYFGDSNLTIDPINSLAKLADLNMKSTINDNILLIKKLSVQFETRNFLVFGANHGGLLASYISNEFATDPNLNMFKILAWASSPILKYMRQGLNDSYEFDFQLINKKFSEILIDSGCDSSAIPHFGSFFNKTRYLIDTDESLYNPVLKKLNLNPIPKAQNHQLYNSGLAEFAIFLRNSMKNLVSKNWKYDENGKEIKKEDNILWKLCEVMKSVPTNDTPIESYHFEDVLLLIVPGYKKVGPPFTWRLSFRAGNNVNRRAALDAYQDCTNWQLMSCTNNSDSDPFAFTGYQLENDCQNMVNFDSNLYDECYVTAYYGLDPSNHVLDVNKYPRSFKRNVITTINSESIYSDAYEMYDEKMEINEENYLWYTKLNGENAREMGSVKKCDSDKMNDVRYLVLRAFACFANLIDDSKEICDSKNLFNDNKNGKDYSDDQKGDDCSDDLNNNFPFGHDPIIFKPQEIIIEEGHKSIVGGQENQQQNVRHETKIKNSSAKLLTSMRNILLKILFLYFLFI